MRRWQIEPTLAGDRAAAMKARHCFDGAVAERIPPQMPGRGFDDYLSKPIRAADLFAAIDRVAFGGGASSTDRPYAGDHASLIDATVLLAACGGFEKLLDEMCRSFNCSWGASRASCDGCRSATIGSGHGGGSPTAMPAPQDRTSPTDHAITPTCASLNSGVKLAICSFKAGSGFSGQ